MAGYQSPVYDRIGRGYVAGRREDPRIARALGGLGDALSVVNVGAGPARMSLWVPESRWGWCGALAIPLLVVIRDCSEADGFVGARPLARLQASLSGI
jgi:hypothetical protein